MNTASGILNALTINTKVRGRRANNTVISGCIVKSETTQNHEQILDASFHVN